MASLDPKAPDTREIVAVTGSSGHIGSYVVRALLDQGRRVRVIDLRHDSPLLEGLAIERVEADITDPEAISKAIQGASVVYHLAALISLQEWDKARMRRVNIDGVKNVVDACLAHKVRRLIHFTSIHAISPFPIEGVVDETRDLALTMKVPAYDRSKAEGVLQVREGIKRGLDVVMLHPVGVIGPGDHRPSHMGGGICLMAEGKLPALIEGGFTWVDVRDVASAALAAEKKGRSGQQYILGGEWKSAADIATMVAHMCGRSPHRMVLPMWFMQAIVPFVAVFSWVTRIPTPFTPASLNALRNHRYVSHAKAERELDHHPRPFEETLADSVAWFRENGYIKTVGSEPAQLGAPSAG